jgi:ABC-type xylose transport system substrate-binding protein
VLLTPLIVTKDTLDDMLVKSGYLKKEQVYRK